MKDLTRNEEHYYLFQKADQWCGRRTGRGFRLNSNLKESWFYPEKEFSIWCYDKTIDEGFHIYTKQDKFLTYDEMLVIKKKNLDEDYKEEIKGLSNEN